MCPKCSSVVARPCTYLEADGDGGGEEVEELRLLLEDLLVVGEDEEEDAERQQHRLTHDVGQLRRHVLRRAVLQHHTHEHGKESATRTSSSPCMVHTG